MDKKLKNKGVKEILLTILGHVIIFTFLRLTIPVVYLVFMYLALYFGQIVLAYVLLFILFLCLLIFSLLLITNQLGKVLNDFWKDMVLYNLYYKGKYSSLFFGILYLVISVMAITAFIKMAVEIGY